MIIVSQDKTSIINFDNISCIQIDPSFGNVGCIEINAESENGELYELGIYETEEKAKEVLQEIIQKYESAQSKLGNTYISLEKYDFVYEMPKDEEEK